MAIKTKSIIIGCYELKHLKTEKVYIGVSKNCERTEYEEKLTLRNNKHRNKELQKDFNDDDSLSFVILKPFSNIENAINYKQKLLDKYNSDNKLKTKLYNLGINARLYNLGLKHKQSDETKAKISKSHTGKRHSEDHKKNVINAISKPIVIENIWYKSATEASRILNISQVTIFKRLNNPNFPEYKYVNKKDD